MPLDPSAKRFLGALAATNPPSARDLTVEERRRALQNLLGFFGPVEQVEKVENGTVPGEQDQRPARVYTPIGAAVQPLPALIFFHGGGLVAGSLDTHDGLCRSLANASGCRVIALDYRLAPEHRFPAPLADCHAATLWIAEHASELGIDPKQIIVGGDSAGATLAAVVCQMIAQRKELALAAQFLLCPIMDFCAQTDSRRAYGEGYLVDMATLEHDLMYYLPTGIEPSDPRVSPLRAQDIGEVPPACIHTAEFDPLCDEGKAYADRLAKAGIRTSYFCHPGMIHLFYAMGAVIPYARAARAQIGAAIRSMLP